jgi:hypothetical protein
MSQRTFQFHQTLHGYNDGHRLLKASRKLPPDVERLMLVMSDMSGSSMVHGFESYLTGYPLKEIKAYALARTWYAPEMKRPGCVWTHTLIIQNTDLANIHQLWFLTASFVRPARESPSWDGYADPLTLLPHEINHQRISPAPQVNPARRQLVRNSLAALYGSPQKQVFLPLTHTSTEYEELTIALWSQQWARLRRAFKFCTGAISNRQLPDGAFDWQIIPRSSAREIKLEVKNAIIVEEGTEGQEKGSPVWLEKAVDDLCSARPTELRRFLKTFGPETSGGRADYVPLVETFAALNEARQGIQPLGRLIDAVTRLFPSPEEGARIKKSFFGTPASTTDKPPLFPHNASEADVLQELARTEHHPAFDAKELQVSSRAATLVKDDFKSASRIAFSLLSSELTPLGEQFIDGFCEGLTSSQTFELSYDQIDLVFPLLKRKPILAASSTLWRGSEHEQRKIFDFIHQRGELNREEVGRVITAMLSADSDSVASNVAYAYTELTVETVLAWCEALPIDSVFKIGAEWKRVLARNAEMSIRWLKRNEAASESPLILLAGILDPHSQAVIRGGAGVWARLSRRAPDLLHGDLFIAVMTFLLALGFNNPDGDAVTLVIESFEPVHSAAQENHLADDHWRLLSYQAASLTWDGDWDRCGRLRGALIDHFSRYRWPHEDFLRCLRNPDLLQKVVAQVLEQGGWFNKNRKYLQKVAEKVVGGEIKGTKSQRDILAASFDL